MHNSFSVTRSNFFDRHFGGTTTGTADPYISGYHFISFLTLPPALLEIMGNDSSNLTMSNEADVKSALSASCIAVTPPGGTLNKAEFTGLGGTKWSVPTNIDYGNTVQIRFYEYSRLPIFHIIHSWFRLIRDYRTGTSPLAAPAGGSSSAYTKKAYSAELLYWTTAPDGVSVEYSALYTGVFPTVDPQNMFSGDLTAVDKLELDIEFSLDRIWKEKWVRDQAQALATGYHAIGKSAHGLAKASGSSTGSNDMKGSFSSTNG